MDGKYTIISTLMADVPKTGMSSERTLFKKLEEWGKDQYDYSIKTLGITFRFAKDLADGKTFKEAFQGMVDDLNNTLPFASIVGEGRIPSVQPALNFFGVLTGAKKGAPYVKRAKTDLIVLHHIAGEGPVELVNHVDHERIGYNLHVRLDGSVYRGRGIAYKGRHVKDTGKTAR